MEEFCEVESKILNEKRDTYGNFNRIEANKDNDKGRARRKKD